MSNKNHLYLFTIISSLIPLLILFLWEETHTNSSIWFLFLVPAICMITLYPSWIIVFLTTLFLTGFKYLFFAVHYQGQLDHRVGIDLFFSLLIYAVLIYVIAFFRIQGHRAEEKLENLANLDPLTGLYNRRYFDHYIRSVLEEHRQSGQSLILLALDIDHFKQLNDNFGHQFGDEVLRKLSFIISECVRESDTVVRMGGEEFIIILPKISESDGYKIAERIRQTVERFPFMYQRNAHYITVSIGLTRFDQSDTSSILYCKADEALYEAKQTGRNKVVIYNKTA